MIFHLVGSMVKNRYLCANENDKSRFMKHVITLLALMGLLFCSCHGNRTTDAVQPSRITAEMALEGVNNYCHRTYDWSVAEDDSTIMYVTMGEETESEYKVIFRSYTGALVNFYVDKANGTTRMVESVPVLGVDSVAGIIDLLDYLDRKN